MLSKVPLPFVPVVKERGFRKSLQEYLQLVNVVPTGYPQTTAISEEDRCDKVASFFPSMNRDLP